MDWRSLVYIDGSRQPLPRFFMFIERYLQMIIITMLYKAITVDLPASPNGLIELLLIQNAICQK